LVHDDWHRAYEAAKGWISGGGGARITDPWCVYIASALLHRQPRTAVHSADLALGNWIADSADRAVLLWLRGEVIRRFRNDPKPAQADLDVAQQPAPSWLHDEVAAAAAACRLQATSSRKRKPSVDPAPAYTGDPSTQMFVRPAIDSPRPGGTRPNVWD